MKEFSMHADIDGTPYVKIIKKEWEHNVRHLASCGWFNKVIMGSI
jgi:hypothetical protein